MTESIDQELLITYVRGDDGTALYDVPIPDDVTNLPSYEADAVFDDEIVGRVLVYFDLSARATDNLESVALTAAERRWLGTHGTLVIGIDPSWPPFEFFDEDGVYSGISSGYMAAIQSRLGVDFEIVREETWKDVVQRAERGEIDILPAMTPTVERERFFNFTRPYISFPMVIATRKDAPFVDRLNDFQGKKVGVVASYLSEEVLRTGYPNIVVETFDSLAAGLRAVEQEEIEAFFGNLATITYEIDRQDLIDLKVAAPTAYAFDLAMGVRKNLPELVSILNKALNNIDERERASIKNTWIAVRVNIGTSLETVLTYALPPAILVVVVGIVIVVWNRRLGAEALERKLAEERTRAIIDTAIDGVISISETGTIQSFSPAAERMFGYGADEVLGENVAVLMSKDISDEHENFITRYLEGGERSVIGTNREVFGRRKDGSSFPMDLAVGESVIGTERIFTGIVRDISARKAAEDRLAETEEQNRLVLGAVGDGIFGTDNQGRVNFVNARACELLGCDADYLMGNRVHALIHHTRPDGSPYPVEECPMWAAFTNGTPSQVDNEVLWRQDGTSFPVEYSATPIKRNNAYIGSVVTFRDISERKAAETRVREAHSLVTDSIRYASRIQRSLLPKDEVLERVFSDFFTIWQPRDVVGGDMYWIKEDRRGYFCALFDCTGHGVPGALMTTIAVSALDVAFTETGDPGRLIARANQYVKNALDQYADVESDSDDGLEMGVCLIEPDRMRATFAGARFDLIYGQGAEFQVIKGDKAGIGYRHVPRDSKYSNHSIRLRPGLRFFLMSDGVIDQIGGPKRRAFGRKRLIELICQSAHLPMRAQRDYILESFEAYEGDEKRRDDVSMVAFKPIA